MATQHIKETFKIWIAISLIDIAYLFYSASHFPALGLGIGELDRRAENIEDSDWEASCRRGRAAADSAASQVSILFNSIQVYSPFFSLASMFLRRFLWVEAFCR